MSGVIQVASVDFPALLAVFARGAKPVQRLPRSGKPANSAQTDESLRQSDDDPATRVSIIPDPHGVLRKPVMRQSSAFAMLRPQRTAMSNVLQSVFGRLRHAS